jgi:hypothetical protein
VYGSHVAPPSSVYEVPVSASAGPASPVKATVTGVVNQCSRPAVPDAVR